MTDIINLAEEWSKAKQAEQEAVDYRRELEDRMTLLLGVSESCEGVTSKGAGDYTIKVTQRINRSVDSDMVQQLAAESGLSDHLGDLFRWKPELNKKQWENAADNIRMALASAITEKPGRPSYSISKNH